MDSSVETETRLGVTTMLRRHRESGMIVGFGKGSENILKLFVMVIQIC